MIWRETALKRREELVRRLAVLSALQEELAFIDDLLKSGIEANESKDVNPEITNFAAGMRFAGLTTSGAV